MKLYLLIPALFLFLTCKSQSTVPDQSINSTFNFELENYLGTWYEIARFDHVFERGLQGVTATYSIRPDGKIKVLNQGFKGSLDGKHKTAVGKARLAAAETPRNLEVSFFWNFYGAYNILEIDEDYQYVLIGSGSANYLWILSRTPQMDQTTFDKLVNISKSRGYDTDKLLMVKQIKQ